MTKDKIALRRRLMNKKFWLSIICDYEKDLEENDIDFVLSKAKIMCWISFFSLIYLAYGQLLGAKLVESIQWTSATEVLKTIFTTTFMYEGLKRGINAYSKKNEE